MERWIDRQRRDRERERERQTEGAREREIANTDRKMELRIDRKMNSHRKIDR